MEGKWKQGNRSKAFAVTQANDDVTGLGRRMWKGSQKNSRSASEAPLGLGDLEEEKGER